VHIKKWCKLLKQKGEKQGSGAYNLIEVINHIPFT